MRMVGSRGRALSPCDGNFRCQVRSLGRAHWREVLGWSDTILLRLAHLSQAFALSYALPLSLMSLMTEKFQYKVFESVAIHPVLESLTWFLWGNSKRIEGQNCE